MISVTGEQPELCLSTLEMGSVDTAELPEISQAAGTDEACSCEIQWKKFLWSLFHLDGAKSLSDNHLLKLKYIGNFM